MPKSIEGSLDEASRIEGRKDSLPKASKEREKVIWEDVRKTQQVCQKEQERSPWVERRSRNRFAEFWVERRARAFGGKRWKGYPKPNEQLCFGRRN